MSGNEDTTQKLNKEAAQNPEEETTKNLAENLSDNLSDRQLLLLLLERVTHLEKAEEDRKRETRPLWERLDGQMGQVLVKLANIEEEQRLMRTDISLFREDHRNERRERAYLAERVTIIEKQLQLA
ncbi:MAG: hypothetical protein HOP19_06065 [Acidobacteria bacterium]|nr:hypothetical protein [Acidobacteriota bacterium]